VTGSEDSVGSSGKEREARARHAAPRGPSASAPLVVRPSGLDWFRTGPIIFIFMVYFQNWREFIFLPFFCYKKYLQLLKVYYVFLWDFLCFNEYMVTLQLCNKLI
jgi:hypothetical protein